MWRVLRLESCHGLTVAYDPCTGLTRLSPHPVPDGRQALDDAAVREWPEIHPSVLSREFPVSVCWSPLVRCNLSCPHCLDDTAVPEAVPAERRRIARLIGSAGILGADISGGEPLLLRELPELAGHLAAAGLATSVTTNGWHLARRAAELAGHVDAIRVSLDGPDPASHDRLRGPGSFDRALDGITASRAVGIPVQVHSVLMTSSAHYAQRMVDLAARAGTNGVTFLQMLPLGAGQAAAAAEMLTDHVAAGLIGDLQVPEGLDVRLRTRNAAEGFTVVRADGRIWRNTAGTLGIEPTQPLRHPADLTLSARDGSA
jgi:sulfatase maturation enzyme AslB (radical SAM superfamily)